MKITVIVAVHKKYRMPEEKCYLPLHVGREGKADIGFAGDNTGDNISGKNPYYCELTGLYWMWKNMDSDYMGLVHYRRYFAGKQGTGHGDKFDQILTEREIKSLLAKNDIILPKKRRYYIENLYSHYAHTHYAEHLDCTREILQEKYPEYVSAFDKVMKRTYGHCSICLLCRAKNVMLTVVGCSRFSRSWKAELIMKITIHFRQGCLEESVSCCWMSGLKRTDIRIRRFRSSAWNR